MRCLSLKMEERNVISCILLFYALLRARISPASHPAISDFYHLYTYIEQSTTVRVYISTTSSLFSRPSPVALRPQPFDALSEFRGSRDDCLRLRRDSIISYAKTRFPFRIRDPQRRMRTRTRRVEIKVYKTESQLVTFRLRGELARNFETQKNSPYGEWKSGKKILNAITRKEKFPTNV